MKPAKFGLASLVLALSLPGSQALAAGGEDVNAATPAATLELAYELYAGGIPLGKAGMSARFQGTDYKAISTLETSGIVNAFWQSKIEAASSGLLGKGRVQPSLYDSFSQNRSAPRRHATLTFDPEGPKTLMSDPPYADNRYPVSDELRKRTLDPLSAVIYLTASASTAADAKPCEAVAPIFDGRRRYDVSFSFVRKTNVRMDNGLYSGPAMVCQVHYKQIAGYQQSVIEDNKKFPKLFAWVIPAKSSSDPDRTFMVPLRVWAETEFGIVVALASQVKLDGQNLARNN
jgi:Protein of unknown function (DUF3108)